MAKYKALRDCRILGKLTPEGKVVELSEEEAKGLCLREVSRRGLKRKVKGVLKLVRKVALITKKETKKETKG